MREPGRGKLRDAPGVQAASVNFATARATVKYHPTATSPEALRDAVRGQGYDLLLSEKGGADDVEDAAERAQEDEYRRVRARFVVAAVLTLPVVALAMAGHVVPSLEATLAFPARPWVELLLTAPPFSSGAGGTLSSARTARPATGRRT